VVVILHPTQGSKEATLNSDRETLSDITTQEGNKGRKKRRKQHLQGTMPMTDGNDSEAGDSDVRHISTTARSNKCQARPPTDHFKRLLEEACQNHTYHIRHKLKDCDMMRSFLTSGSLTWGAELDEGPDGSDTMPFPEKNVIMMVYGGCPPSGRRRVSSLSPRAPACCGWGHEGTGM
jgi:hypothetical protein